jgi:hypothetical protein
VRADRLDETGHAYNSLKRDQQTSELNTEPVNRVLSLTFLNPDDS